MGGPSNTVRASRGQGEVLMREGVSLPVRPEQVGAEDEALQRYRSRCTMHDGWGVSQTGADRLQAGDSGWRLVETGEW
jgi:hypothetical protein